MRRTLAATAVAAVAGALVTVPTANAGATATHDESITVVSFGPPGSPALVIARGAVSDIGSLTPNDTDVDTLDFADGHLLIDETGTTTFTPPAPPTCIARFRTTGTYTVVGGTGRFRHATGNGTSVDAGIELTSRSARGCVEPGVFVYDRGELHGTLDIR